MIEELIIFPFAQFLSMFPLLRGKNNEKREKKRKADEKDKRKTVDKYFLKYISFLIFISERRQFKEWK